nr:hypothetical protein GCM10017745_38540 [Saccharothrix mutabilis subsp. capreolus]
MALVATGAGAVAVMAVAVVAGPGERREGPAAPVAIVAEAPVVTTAPTTTQPTTTTTTTVTPTEPPVVEPQVQAPPTVDLAGVAPGVRRGVVVFDRDAGAEVFAERPEEAFPAASVIKLLIALDALERGTAAPDVVAEMLSTSDDGIANRLWRQAIPRTWAARIGLDGLVPPPDPNMWGDTLMTARDVVAVYRYVLDSPRADVVLPALANATPRGADGVDQTFGIPAGLAGHRWAVKQGWACCYSGQRALNTTGVVDDRFLVAVLTEQPASTGFAAAAKKVTVLAAALDPLFESA